MRSSSPRFVARDADLAHLERLLDEAAMGTSRLALVAGEAGLGKSRLLGELAASARGRRVVVAIGLAVPLLDARIPYGPIESLLRDLLRQLRAEERRRVVSGLEHALAGILPHSDTASDTRRPDRVIRALRDMLERATERETLIVAIEDIHWADPATLDVLTVFARQPVAGRLLIVATHRTDDAAGDDLRRFLAGLGTAAARIELAPLGRAAVREQMAGILGANPRARLVDDVHARAGGNPFFVEQLLAGGPDAPLSGTLREALVARLDRLSPPARHVVDVAAVAGPTVGHELLAAVADIGDRQLVSALREAVVAHVLESDEEDAAYRFRHALLGEAAYGTLLAGERRRLHLAYAELLTERPTLGTGTRPMVDAAVASHLHAAGELRRALPALVAAGTGAMAIHAYAVAHRQLAAAIELWRQHLADPSEIDAQALLTAAAECAHYAGDRLGAAALVREAIDIADTSDRWRLVHLHERLARYLWTAGLADEGTAAYRRAVDLLPAERNREEAAIAIAGLAHALAMLDRVEEAGAKAREALAIAEAVGSEQARGRALATVGLATAEDDAESGLALITEATEIARRLEDLDEVGRTYAYLAGVLLELGRLEDALRVSLDCYALMRDGGSATSGAFSAGTAAEELLLLGRAREAVRLVDESLEADPDGLSALNVLLGGAAARIWTDDLGAAEEACRRVREMIDALEPPATFRIRLERVTLELALVSGGAARAGEAAFAGFDLAQAGGDPSQRAELAALAAATSTLDAGAAWAPRLRRRVRQAMRTLERGARGTTPLAAAFLASARAELEPPASDRRALAWAAAADAWRAIGGRLWEGAALLGEAAAWLGAGDRDRASAALGRAHAVARAADAPRLTGMVAGLGRRARIGLEPSPSPAGGVAGLTTRELDIIHLVAKGRSNQQIADELFLSVRTVERHLANAYARLGLSGRSARSAAAAAVSRHSGSTPG